MKFIKMLKYIFVLICIFSIADLKKVIVKYDTEKDIIIYNNDIFMQNSNNTQSDPDPDRIIYNLNGKILN